jgi:metal-sulfur cluster biosynthetic enzyme
MRWLLAHARVACAEIDVDSSNEKETVIRVTVTAIGCDEYHFIEKCKEEIGQLITRLTGALVEMRANGITDAVTGDPLEGSVAL